MAELLVRVVDRIHDDFFLNAQSSKRGDVIAICPDGWPWGLAELANPDWRIVRVRGLAEDAIALLLEPEALPKDHDPGLPHTAQKRLRKLDVDDPAIDAARLRTFFDSPETVPVTATGGKTLEEIAEKTVVVSLQETAVIRLGQLEVQKTALTRGITRYPINQVDVPTVGPLVASVAFVGETVRVQCVTDCDPDLIKAITILKAPIPVPIES